MTMERMHGTPKARVLPEPVSATPTTSRLERRKGHAAAWMGVGDLKLVKGEAAEGEDFGKYAKSIIGRRVEEVGSVIVMKLVERNVSISGCGNTVSLGSSVYVESTMSPSSRAVGRAFERSFKS